MGTTATDQTNLISESEFARMRLLKGADLENIEDLLVDFPIFSFAQGQSIEDSPLSDCSLLVLMSGRLELEEEISGLPSVVTAGDYVGGLNPATSNYPVTGYKAIQDSRVMAFNEDMLKSLMMVSHSAAVNLNMLALDQLKHMPAANDVVAQSMVPAKTDVTTAENLEAPKLHDAKWLEELLDRQIIRSLTDQESLSIAVLEIDETDVYKDKHGDESIKFVSNTVTRCILDHVRPGDMVARIDEEHFVVVLPKASAEDAQIPAERLCNTIAETEVSIPNDCTLPAVTISVGITQLTAMVGAEKLVKDAIEALGRARENGPSSISD